MTRHVGQSLMAAALGASLIGCTPPPDSEADAFRKGVPRAETVTARVPGAAGQAQVEEQALALRGDTAELYKLTYGVTHLLNGGAFFVGALVKAVLAFPPTSIAGDTATWGPWTDDLEPIAWKVTITRVAERQFQYRFEGQPKGNPGAPFVTVLAGAHTAGVTADGQAREGYGAGSFTLDWDARNTLPLPKPKERGKAHYTYSRLDDASDAKIDAQFKQVLDDDTGKLVDVDYAYVKAAAGGGRMDFVWFAPAQRMMAAGKWAVRSRWQSGGAGRADVRAFPEGIPGPLTASECWNGSFASTYLRASWEPAAGYGAEATDCAFPAAEYSGL